MVWVNDFSWVDDFDAFFFDFDGTLADTEPLHFRAYKRMCEKFGCFLNWNFEHYTKIAHFSNEGLKQTLLPLLQEKVNKPWEFFYSKKRRYFEQMIVDIDVPLLQGVKELLELLQVKNKKRCVVTNSTQKQVDIIKKRSSTLQTIDHWVTREAYCHPKPAPDSYLKAIELYGEKQDRMIGFEDTLKGIESLRLSGIKPVLICPKTHPQLEKTANIAHFESFSEIVSL